MSKPKVYKFSFYACESIYNKDKKTKKQLIEEVAEVICYCDSLTIVRDIEVEAFEIKKKGGK
tara:strand:+ start:3651 stop:3836 length:186 start_codon:yes stop_codon:yes gene_type:complete